jgi:beta-galactosidase
MMFAVLTVSASYQPVFSTAGFFQLPGTGRSAYSMNPAWRFHKGHADGAEQNTYNDKSWTVVSLPHGIEYLPAEASGCVNYQGEVWYRKHFTPLQEWRGKQLSLYFEAIMGKCKVWVNGQLMKEHLGGFLPVIVDVSQCLKYGEDNVITVMADNSDDPSYPPGKAQDVLDFTYAGGIYRDCWMIAHNSVFITDPNAENTVAGGGLFVSYDKVDEHSSDIRIDAQIRNVTGKNFEGKIVYEFVDKGGHSVIALEHKLRVTGGRAVTVTDKATLQHPHLWSPDDPYLYHLRVFVKDLQGNTVDGYEQRIGVRSIEFKGKDGFWLNGKPYPEPLIGANRHQDFAVIGNALPNSLHWRDAKKLRDAGLRVIRNAHYPQDPAFMDACDELGLFVIVNTPGWQFWNEAPSFAQDVYSDIRNIVRRDRNHPSVWLWEPILNETWYPADFAKKVKDIVHEEYPYPYCYAACDASARGSENYNVLFSHPQTGDPSYGVKSLNPKITYFTREWGDNVDDWNSHNSPSRASRAWGEIPMLVQAQGYAKPSYQYTCYDALYRTTRQHVGGCLWHSFDHQRGYHPDPFYGGIMDNFRQPKYSYYMFESQRPAQKNDSLIAETGPMVYIANAMTPFSPSDVTVYSNCDEVRLTYCKGGRQYVYQKPKGVQGMPSPVITFKDVFHVMDDKALSRDKHQTDSYLLAEGLMDGKVVATHRVMPARRASRIKLWVDNEGTEMKADGSDIVTVVAAVTDDNGTIKRLNNEQIRFDIEGPGRLLADESSFTNPRAVQWGTAPVLVQSTTVPGTIHIRASVVWQGKTTPIDGEIDIQTVKADHPFVADENELKSTFSASTKIGNMGNVKAETSRAKLKEVEQQQADFE